MSRVKCAAHMKSSFRKLRPCHLALAQKPFRIWGTSMRMAHPFWKPRGLGKALPDGYAIKALERIGIFADQQYQGGGLRVGFGSALFPFLESSFVDPHLRAKTACEQRN